MVWISVHGLKKTINDRTLFEDVDLTLEDRDKVALVGTNGTGKSTLLRILATQSDYDQGELALLDLLAKQTPDAKMPPVSLSWGFAISRKEKPVTMEKLESMADARMYEMKVQMKAERLD